MEVAVLAVVVVMALYFSIHRFRMIQNDFKTSSPEVFYNDEYARELKEYAEAGALKRASRLKEAN